MNIAKRPVDCWLKEINFSTGDEYSKYDEDVLRNAILINLQNANFEE